jgi:hypothetical protein
VTARPGSLTPATASAIESIERLYRSLDASATHGSKVAEALVIDGEVWHAGLLAGAVISIRAALRTVEVVKQQLTGQLELGEKNGVRQPTGEQTSAF